MISGLVARLNGNQIFRKENGLELLALCINHSFLKIMKHLNCLYTIKQKRKNCQSTFHINFQRQGEILGY